MSIPPTRAPGDVLMYLRRARDHADRYYREPLDLGVLVAVANLSKFHFQRLFSVTYGHFAGGVRVATPCRASAGSVAGNELTATEVCFAVGFRSVGSFGTRFRELVGESPSAFQRRYSATGAPRVPGCFVFTWGLAERRSASEEKRTAVQGL